MLQLRGPEHVTPDKRYPRLPLWFETERNKGEGGQEEEHGVSSLFLFLLATNKSGSGLRLFCPHQHGTRPGSEKYETENSENKLLKNL